MKQQKKESLNHYFQVVKEMNRLNMSKDQQIEYLKRNLLYCEYKMKRKNLIERLLFFGLFFALLAFYFISIKCYFVGFLFLLIPGICISYKIITLAEENNEDIKESERKKLVSLLNSNLE